MRYELEAVLRQLWRSKLTALVMAIFMGAATLVSVWSAEHFLYEYSFSQARRADYKRPVTKFAVTAIQRRDEIKDATENFKQFAAVVGEDTLTWCDSFSLTKLNHYQTVLVFGDASLLFDEALSDQGIRVFADAPLEEIMIEKTVYPVQQSDVMPFRKFIKEGSVDETFQDPLIVVYAPTIPKDWAEVDRPDVLHELMEHTVVDSERSDKIKALLEPEQNSFMAVRKDTAKKGDDLAFISGYNVPFILLSLLVFFLCTYLILAGMIEQQQRRLVIEFFFGAGITRLCIRFGVTFLLLLLPGYGLYIWFSRLLEFTFVSNGMVLAAYLLIWLLYLAETYELLKRSDLQSKMKGV